MWSSRIGLDSGRPLADGHDRGADVLDGWTIVTQKEVNGMLEASTQRLGQFWPIQRILPIPKSLCCNLDMIGFRGLSYHRPPY